MSKNWFYATGICLAVLGTTVSAQPIKIGLTGTFTGANASNGIPYRNAAELFPKEVNGHQVQWIVLDDGGDASNAMKNVRRFVDVDKVDFIVGSTSTPTALATLDLANNSQTVQLAMSPIQIPDNKKDFVFNLPQPAELMTAAVVEDMQAQGVKSVSYIGYADGWGDLIWDAFAPQAQQAGIEIATEERYNRTDTSVTAQVLKTAAANPDAVFIGGSTMPAALPQVGLRERDYDGQIYQTHAAVAQAFLDAGGAAAEGTRLPGGPMTAANELAADNPIKAVAQDFISQYQAKWGDGPVPIFAGYAWDAMLILNTIIPPALEQAQPGSAEFRVALRDVLESGIETVGTNAVYSFSETDHYGVDERARVMLEVQDGAFQLIK